MLGWQIGSVGKGTCHLTTDLSSITGLDPHGGRKE